MREWQRHLLPTACSDNTFLAGYGAADLVEMPDTVCETPLQPIGATPRRSSVFSPVELDFSADSDIRSTAECERTYAAAGEISRAMRLALAISATRKSYAV